MLAQGLGFSTGLGEPLLATSLSTPFYFQSQFTLVRSSASATKAQHHPSVPQHNTGHTTASPTPPPPTRSHPVQAPLQPLPTLPLIRLHVLKRKPTRPLIGPSLPADAAGAARKQNTPEAHGGQEAVAGHADDERGGPGLHVLGVGEEGAGGVEDDGQRECRDGVGGFGVGGVGRDAGTAGCAGVSARVAFQTCWGREKLGEGRGGGLHSAKVDCSGTEPVRRMVRMPMAMRAKPRVREK